MLSDDVRRKLRGLTRGDVADPDSVPATVPGVAAGGRPCAGGTTARAAGPPRRVATPVATDAPLGGDEAGNEFGAYLEIRQPVSEVAQWGEEFWEALRRALAAHPGALGGVQADEAVFLDIETTGLSAQPLFLIGLLHTDESGPHATQLLARDYTEEPAVIAAGLGYLQHAKTLVTYNGRSFDVPYIKDRARYHRLRIDFPKPRHVDLLLHARQQLRGVLPNCRLQTLERHLCGIVRAGDIPGEQIPEAYHEFVRWGSPRRMHEILYHNRLDLVTLAALVGELLRP